MFHLRQASLLAFSTIDVSPPVYRTYVSILQNLTVYLLHQFKQIATSFLAEINRSSFDHGELYETV